MKIEYQTILIERGDIPTSGRIAKIAKKYDGKLPAYHETRNLDSGLLITAQFSESQGFEKFRNKLQGMGVLLIDEKVKSLEEVAA